MAARKECKPPAVPGRRWKWADGKMHDEPPPSSETMEVPPPPPKPAPLPGQETITVVVHPDGRITDPPKPAKVNRPAVPENFSFTERARLRAQALDFALRAASVLNYRVGSGAEILSEAEEIEKWIAQP